MLNANTPLLGLTNIGTTIAARLAEVGVHTVGDLRKRGVVSTYLHLKARQPNKTLPVCYYLYALAGALEGVHWRDLPEKTKQQLLRQVR